MKLAIVRQRYNFAGGAERFVERALESLHAQGVDVTLIARHWQGEGCGERIFCDPFYIGRTWRDSSFARAVQKLIATGRFDLVQSHERIPGCHIYRAGDGVHATWLDLAGKSFTAFSPWHRYTLAAEAAMFCHPALRAVICNSHMVKDDIARRFPETAHKLQVIYNGVDTDHFHPGLRDEYRTTLRAKVGADETVPVILFVGSGFARKGVGTLIKTLARMQNRAAEVWIVGRDRHQTRYAEQARQLGIAGRVRFFGAQTEVRPFYAAADVFCLPTLYDPLPNAALEALACGLPTVTTPTSGAAELITPGINGQISPLLDPVTLANQLDALCEPGRALSMRPAARACVEHLSPAAMAEQLVALYLRLSQTNP